MKSFGQKNFEIPCTDQKLPFWQFFRKGRDGHAQLVRPSRIPRFLLWVPKNSQQCQKAKLERAYSFRFQSGKIIYYHLPFVQKKDLKYLSTIRFFFQILSGCICMTINTSVQEQSGTYSMINKKKIFTQLKSRK